MSVPPAVEGRHGPSPHHVRKFILCFDGTGNKFSGTDADSNILKIYRMLDRSDHTQFHYYQPGIGTYVATKSVSHHGYYQRLKSWYTKSKDSMFGTSLADHVLGGYKFLMRYYRVGDEIYMFGFSRGAYTARFLAEMIDHVGLLSQGNEELISFAWKTFQKWQTRKLGKTEKEREDNHDLLRFMMSFRETFARPVRPIRFLGLFDTVNSVPRFENALMSRTKFPYTARSTAKVIRHAVSINERRAKFRQDLVGEKKTKDNVAYRANGLKNRKESIAPGAQRPGLGSRTVSAVGEESDRGRAGNLQVPTLNENFRDPSETAGVRGSSPGQSFARDSDVASHLAFAIDDDEDEEQNIQEVWFAGCHADIGGGWPLQDDEEVALSHIPLVWMVREAQRAGLRFDERKVHDLNCNPDGHEVCFKSKDHPRKKLPQIVEPGENGDIGDEKVVDKGSERTEDDDGEEEEDEDEEIIVDDLPMFHRKIHLATIKGYCHDVLCRNNGAGIGGVLAWNFMEHLPLRRMDLQDDGSWKPIRWPIPKGETRDIPDNVVVHNSVIRRMKADKSYRPGNLIIGGGGRGVRIAPPEFGIGKWKVIREEGDWVGECYVRAEKSIGSKYNSEAGVKKLLAERKKTMETENEAENEAETEAEGKAEK